jgi:hypothetical protein
LVFECRCDERAMDFRQPNVTILRDCEAWHSGDHMDFPHLIDFGVVGLLAFLLLLGVKTAYDFRDQGRSVARKIQRIATTIAIATIAGQSFFGAFC